MNFRLGLLVAGESLVMLAGTETCHIALTGMARSLAPKGRVAGVEDDAGHEVVIEAVGESAQPAKPSQQRSGSVVISWAAMPKSTKIKFAPAVARAEGCATIRDSFEEEDLVQGPGDSVRF